MNHILQQAARCRELAADAVTDGARGFWAKMEQYWLRRAEAERHSRSDQIGGERQQAQPKNER
jgi:hypothetical protein